VKTRLARCVDLDHPGAEAVVSVTTVAVTDPTSPSTNGGTMRGATPEAPPRTNCRPCCGPSGCGPSGSGLARQRSGQRQRPRGLGDQGITATAMAVTAGAMATRDAHPSGANGADPTSGVNKLLEHIERCP
jgi:hypothetical protein